MYDNKITFENSTIFSIVGNNKNVNYLLYYLIGKFYNSGYKLGVVMGNSFPYIQYISDNIYIRYDDIVFSNYLKNLKRQIVENNLLIVDTKHLNLNTKDWIFFLENHKLYKTTIIFVFDNINISNINLLKKHTDYVYILKPTLTTINNNCNFINIDSNIEIDYEQSFSANTKNIKYESEFIKRCYDTFGKTLKYDIFVDFYNRSTNDDNMLFSLNKHDKILESFYSQMFCREIEDYYFDTVKIYNEKEKYYNVCKIRGDILFK
jgi:hypothetical protein